MQTFEFSTQNFQKTDGYLSYKFGDNYELAIEPSLEGNIMFISLYQNQQLLTAKIPIKKGITENIYEIPMPQTFFEDLNNIETREKSLQTGLKLTPFKKIAKLCLGGIQRCQMKKNEILKGLKDMDPRLKDYDVMDYNIQERKITAYNKRHSTK